jgi:hypothetical protein
MKPKRGLLKTWPSGMPRREQNEDFERPLRAKTASYISNVSNLPLAHVSTVYAAREIVKQGKIKTSDCPIFNVPLTYFFVLRPAYLVPHASEKSEYLDYFPVAFILRPEAVAHPYHVYPFDTGAGAKGAYKDRANRLVKLEDYELEPSHRAARSFIQWAFGDTRGYFEGFLRPDLNHDIIATESVASSYANIAKMGRKGDSKTDVRASTIELTSNSHVDLPSNVLLMIIPSLMLEESGQFGTARDHLISSGTSVLTYDWRPSLSPIEFHNQLFELSDQWLSKNGHME